MSKTFSLFFLCSFLLISCAKQKVSRTSSKPKALPAWIRNRPVEPGYYTGVGAAKIEAQSAKHIDIAKSNALNDLVSEIEVTISSNSIMRQVENNTEFKEEFESMSQSSIKDKISGFELVDSWGSEETYWVYYRLSKRHYQDLKNQEMNRVQALAKDLYQKALFSKAQGETDEALKLLLKGLNELRYYLNEEFFVEVDGSQRYLTNELLTEIMGIFSNVKVQLNLNELNVKMGKPIDVPINLKCVYGRDEAMAALPFKSSFVRGGGTINAKSITDQSGEARFVLGSVNGAEDFQELKLSLDVHSLLGGSENEAGMLEELLSLQTAIPAAVINIRVEPLLAYYSIVENEFKEGLDRRVLSNEIKRMLSANNVSFTMDKDKADVIIELNDRVTKGKHIQSHNVYTVYQDAYLSIIKNDSGNKIFFKGFDQIRGQQVGNWNNALKEAQSVTIDRFKKEIMPELKKISY